jgi:hypothetical protein
LSFRLGISVIVLVFGKDILWNASFGKKMGKLSSDVLQFYLQDFVSESVVSEGPRFTRG